MKEMLIPSKFNYLENNKVDKINGKGLSTNDLTDDILSEINKITTKYDTNTAITELSKKRDKAQTITMADLAQDVKTAMTGGSVAVVGVNAVNTANLVNNSVTGNKIALDTINNHNLSPSSDVQLKVEYVASGSVIRATYNNDKSVDVWFRAIDIQMLKKTLVRHTSIAFSGASEGEVFNIPNNARLVWRYTNADGTFGHTKEVLQKDQACINADNVILLQNTNGRLHGKLAHLIQQPIDINYINDNSIDNKKIHPMVNCVVRCSKEVETEFLRGNDSGKILVSFKAPFTINLYSQNGEYFKGKTFTTNTTYIIPNFGGLYYNFDTNDLLEVANGSSVESDRCICLINNSSNGMLSGAISHACTNRFWGSVLRDGTIIKSKLSADIQKVLDKADAITENKNLPSYWNDYLNNKIPQIQTLQENDVNGFSFAFLTDTHIDMNEVLLGVRNQPLFSGNILSRLDESLNLSSVLHGGDMVSLQTTETGCRGVIRETVEKYLVPFRDKVLCTVGNHDIVYEYREPTKSIDKKYLYSLMHKPFSKGLVMGDLTFTNEPGSGTLYGYKEDVVNKVRYISLCCFDTKVAPNYFAFDVAFLGEQLRWLSEKALKVNEDGWKFVIFTHQPFVNELAFGHSIPHNSDSLKKILEDFVAKRRCTISTSGGAGIRPVNIDVDFSNYKGKLICILNGHMHTDKSTTLNGVNYIEVESDVIQSSSDSGTTNEHSISVFTVCPGENKVKVNRIGRQGEDFVAEYVY